MASAKFVSNRGGKTFEMVRNLSEHGVFIRYNEAVEIIRKIKSIGEPPLSELASPLFPFRFIY